MSAPHKPLDEFAAIAACFAPLAAQREALGLLDDAAVLSPPAGMDLVFTKDAMVEGVHFLADDPPHLVARKLWRVNLSDLAAMGAQSLGYLVALAVRKENAGDWIKDFATGLAADQQIFSGRLWGGDTVVTSGPVTLSLTAVGAVPRDQALKRSGARPGDLVAMTGTLGDGALGLLAAQGKLNFLAADHVDYLAARYRLPTPRLAAGAALRGLATAAMDISDGLMGDMAHICRASGVGARLRWEDLPLSAAARSALAREPSLQPRLFGGDDYELLFTVPPDRRADLAAVARGADVAIAVIGEVIDGSTVQLFTAAGERLDIPATGYTHF